jgi:ABC-type transporter Mla MlaB component
MSLAIQPRVRLPEALDTLRKLQRALASAAEMQELDLAALNDGDSSVLAILLALKREFGARVSFVNPPDRLRSMARLYGVETLILGTCEALSPRASHEESRS